MPKQLDLHASHAHTAEGKETALSLDHYVYEKHHGGIANTRHCILVCLTEQVYPTVMSG
jgi:hypothetical protein